MCISSDGNPHILASSEIHARRRSRESAERLASVDLFGVVLPVFLPLFKEKNLFFSLYFIFFIFFPFIPLYILSSSSSAFIKFSIILRFHHSRAETFISLLLTVINSLISLYSVVSEIIACR